MADHSADHPTGHSTEGRRGRLAQALHNPITAKIILALAVGLTISAWYFSKQVVENADREQFQLMTQEVESAVRDRMVVYEQVLWGGVGLFNASNEVSRDEWEEYVAALDLDEHWPGIQGLGFAVPVAPDEREAHVARIQAEGFPEYQIKPEGERPEYSSIIFLEPFDWRNQRAFGFDMWSNDLRREAMARARDDNAAATSGVITLVQETDDDVQKGFLTYVPVYDDGVEPPTVEGRQQALAGWVYAAFRTNDLMAGVLGQDLHGIDFEIFDGLEPSADTLLYDSDTTRDAALGDEAVLRRSTVVEMQGRQWSILYEANDAFGTGAARNLPNVIGLAGLVIDVLLFYVISSLAFMEKRASALALGMTSELRSAKEGLEDRSKELETQAERLRRSNAELEQFAYVASHDLQEPLRTIVSYSTMLRKNYSAALGDEGDRWLGYVGSSADRMSSLIRQILHYSTLDSELRELELVPLDEVVSLTTQALSESIDKSGATITVGKLPEVLGYPDQLSRLFQNLIANAIKYRREQDPPVIFIEAAEVGDEWRISVRDNGIGINPNYHQRIFEIFRRVGSRTKYSGTGIGLSVCSKIVELHGGTIGVDSTLGDGSEFWFTMPACRIQTGVPFQPAEMSS